MHGVYVCIYIYIYIYIQLLTDNHGQQHTFKQFRYMPITCDQHIDNLIITRAVCRLFDVSLI